MRLQQTPFEIASKNNNLLAVIQTV